MKHFVLQRSPMPSAPARKRMTCIFDKDSPVYGPFGPFGRSVFNESVPLGPHSSFTGLLHRETGQPHGYGTKSSTHVQSNPEWGYRKVKEIIPDVCQACFADGVLVAESSSSLTCGRWVNGVPHGLVHERSSIAVKTPSSTVVLVSSVCFDGSLVNGVRHGTGHSCSMLDNSVFEDVYENGKRVKRTLVSSIGDQTAFKSDLMRQLTAECRHVHRSPYSSRSTQLAAASPAESNGLSPAVSSGRRTTRVPSALSARSVIERPVGHADPLASPPRIPLNSSPRLVNKRPKEQQRPRLQKLHRPPAIHCGQHVVAVVDREDHPGVVLYVGPKQHGDKLGFVVGMCCDGFVPGAHNGVVGGFQYFVCEEGRGLLVPSAAVFPDATRRPFT